MRKSLLECSDEELLGIVGDYALRLEYGSEPPSDKEQCEAGRWWFDAQINKHKGAICRHPFVAALLVRSEVDAPLALGFAIALVIELGIFQRPASETSEHIAAFSTLLVRSVMSGFCSNQSQAN
ncbi:MULTISPECIES: hypothetical protein [unclassified Citromicrobium]|uniref:hypothetical protein n=1 Tax=unclassified Citromicrobium TaxID=2630544 RepID=UPI0012E278D4|nr:MULTISPECIES: hypothetical protein [unclassified Citromicrobium]|tara:strand:- start:10447 stop:10818 length:372 start_codon:yes stop_codon:yes gene_type:complete